jgi:hypothetical protein
VCAASGCSWLFSLLQLGEVGVHAVKAGVQHLLVLGEPTLQRPQTRGLEPIQPAAALGAATYEADLAEDAEMLRDRGLRNREAVDDLPDGALAADQRVEDLATIGFGDRVEDIRRCRRSSHARDHMRISEYVNAEGVIAHIVGSVKAVDHDRQVMTALDQS